MRGVLASLAALCPAMADAAECQSLFPERAKGLEFCGKGIWSNLALDEGVNSAVAAAAPEDWRVWVDFISDGSTDDPMATPEPVAPDLSLMNRARKAQERVEFLQIPAEVAVGSEAIIAYRWSKDGRPFVTIVSWPDLGSTVPLVMVGTIGRGETLTEEGVQNHRDAVASIRRER